MIRSLIICATIATVATLTAPAMANDEIEPGAFVVTSSGETLAVTQDMLDDRGWITPTPPHMVRIYDVDELDILEIVPPVTAEDRVNNPEAFNAWFDAREQWTVAVLLDEIEPGAFVFTADYGTYMIASRMYDDQGNHMVVPPQMVLIEDLDQLDITRVVPTITEADRIDNPSRFREWVSVHAAWSTLVAETG